MNDSELEELAPDEEDEDEFGELVELEETDEGEHEDFSCCTWCAFGLCCCFLLALVADWGGGAKPAPPFLPAIALP